MKTFALLIDYSRQKGQFDVTISEKKEGNVLSVITTVPLTIEEVSELNNAKVPFTSKAAQFCNTVIPRITPNVIF